MCDIDVILFRERFVVETVSDFDFVHPETNRMDLIAWLSVRRTNNLRAISISKNYQNLSSFEFPVKFMCINIIKKKMFKKNAENCFLL